MLKHQHGRVASHRKSLSHLNQVQCHSPPPAPLFLTNDLRCTTLYGSHRHLRWWTTWSHTGNDTSSVEGNRLTQQVEDSYGYHRGPLFNNSTSDGGTCFCIASSTSQNPSTSVSMRAVTSIFQRGGTSTVLAMGTCCSIMSNGVDSGLTWWISHPLSQKWNNLCPRSIVACCPCRKSMPSIAWEVSGLTTTRSVRNFLPSNSRNTCTPMDS